MNLPGSPTHQKILQLLIDVFKQDKNIRAFILFGSLVRGNWNKYSDLDLDVIVTDSSKQIVKHEIEKIIHFLNTEQIEILIYFEEFSNEFVFILDTLDMISIRFHLLEDTHPAIIDSMKILYGTLTTEQIKSSQNLSYKKEANYLLLNNKFLEHAIYVQISLKRNRLINVSFFLGRMRQIIIEIYTKARGKREFDFEKIVDQEIKQEFMKTFPALNHKALDESFKKVMNLYQTSIEQISLGQIKLSGNEKLILEKVARF